MNDLETDDVRGVAETMASEHPNPDFDQKVWAAEGAAGNRFEVLRRQNGNVVFCFIADGQSIGFEIPAVAGDLLPKQDLINFMQGE